MFFNSTDNPNQEILEEKLIKVLLLKVIKGVT